MTVFNPFDFFLEPSAETFPFAYEPWLRAGAGAVPRSGCRPVRGSRRFWRRSTAQPRRTIDFLVELNRRLPQDIALHHPAGAGRADAARRRSRCGSGSCRDIGWLLVQILRHLGLAARFVSGYLIQLTPDVKPLDGPAGADRRLHRSARLGRGLPARRRLDRPRPDVRPARRRGPHPARRDARSAERRAGDRRRRTSARSTFDHEMTRAAHPRDPARHQAVHRGAVARDRRARPARRRRARGRRRAADDGRRADVRVDRRHGRRGVEHRRARRRRSASWPAALLRRLQAAVRARAACCITARASGIPASRCRAGRSAATGGATASRSGTTTRSSPTRRSTTGTARREAQRFIDGARRRAGRRRRSTSSPRTRTSGTTSGRNGGCR